MFKIVSEVQTNLRSSTAYSLMPLSIVVNSLVSFFTGQFADIDNDHNCINDHPHQDGGGDGKMSREGISPNHYEESFKQEVVAFTRATSRKEATEK